MQNLLMLVLDALKCSDFLIARIFRLLLKIFAVHIGAPALSTTGAPHAGRATDRWYHEY